MAVVSTGKYVMPYFLSEFLGQHPMVELKMDVSNKQQVKQSLKNNEIDFALVSIMPDDLHLNKIDLIDNKLYMVGQSKKNQNERPKKISDCSPLIYREKGSGTRQTMEKFIERKKIQPIKPIELTSNEAVKQAILSGMGYSIMPIIGIKNELNNGQLEIISIPGLPIRTVWRLVWLSEKKLSVIAEQYLKHVKTKRNEIISKHFSWLE
jgi:DNA-binding transcriptional LysR family regulator